MKNILLIVFLLLSVNLFAQVKIGDNPETINQNSILELESNNKVLVISRMTQAQMQAITPLNGALVYNTDENCIFQYNNNAWNSLCVDVMANETVTTIIQNPDGSISYVNESGDTTIVSINDADSDPTNELYDDTQVQSDILNNTTNIASNATNIVTNTSDIATNTSNITSNTNDIANNTTAINTNASDITDNENAINTNTTNITTNAGDIANNTTAINTNASDITDNENAINTNTTNITTNAGDIANNTTAINTNATNITTNANDIANHIANDLDTNPNNEIQTISSTDNSVSVTPNGNDYDLSVTIPVSNDNDPTNELQNLGSNIILPNEEVEITISDGTSTTINIEDLDSDPTNELYDDTQVQADIANNASNISTNTSDIVNNTTAINTNASDITDNENAINTNTTNITTNAGDIANNTTAINTNTTNITTNANDIADNTTAINTNTANITVNTGNIADNETDINTNAANITTNANSITNHIANDLDTNPNNEIQTITSTDGSVSVTPNGDDYDLSITIPVNNDNDSTNELQNLGSNVITPNEEVEITISDGTSTTINIEDADNDPTNELYDDTQVQADIATNTTNITTNSGNITNNTNAINNNTSDIADNETAIIANTNNITTNTNNITNNTNNIANNASDIANNETAINTNTTNITNNTNDIADNTNDITDNASDIADNETAINTNTTNITNNTNDIADNANDITDNASDIADNETAINTNTTNINSNTANITTNTANITTNTANITTNTDDISDNANDISTNTSNIATNTTNITTNTSAIANHIANDLDTNPNNEIQTITSTDGSVSVTPSGNDYDLSIIVPTNNDNDATNEFQDLGNNVVTPNEEVEITISDGANTTINIEDADSDPENELQDISLSGTTLSLSNPATAGNEVDLTDNITLPMLAHGNNANDEMIWNGTDWVYQTAVLTVNGNTPNTSGNIVIPIGTVFTGGDADPTAPGFNTTQIGGTPDEGDIYIVNNSAADPADVGSTYIYDMDTTSWIEIDPFNATLYDPLYVNIDGDTMTGTLNMGNNPITGLPAPVNASDAVNMDYVDNMQLVDNNDGTISLNTPNGITIDTVDKADITANPDGTYTFTNNDGSDVIINTNGLAITNLSATGNQIATLTQPNGTMYDINETVTEINSTSATGNTIGVYVDENSNNTNINETVTTLDINAGELEYTNEDGTNANVDLISTDVNNAITAGTDGALHVNIASAETTTNITNEVTSTHQIATYVNEDNVSQPINETVTELDISAGELEYTNEDGTNANVDLISANANNNITAGTDGALFVDVSAQETLTTITGNSATGNTIATYENENGDTEDINETITELDINAGALEYTNEDGSNANVTLVSADANNNITAGTDGALFVDVSAQETLTTITGNSATGNTIATYENENGDTEDINETITELDINAGALEYTNEDGSNANVALVSTDANNNITAGTDGALFVDVSAQETLTTITGNSATGNTIATYENENGDTEDINETITELDINAGELEYTNEDGSNANVALVSTDANNNITAGTDGALFVDVSAQETITTITGNSATGNTIATYENENGDTEDINETITTLSDESTAGTASMPATNAVSGTREYEYENEDGDTETVNTSISDISFDNDSNILTITEDTAISEVNLSGLSNSPWDADNDDDPATATDTNIYHNGNVGIGDFNGETVDYGLHVKGQGSRVAVFGDTDASYIRISNNSSANTIRSYNSAGDADFNIINNGDVTKGFYFTETGQALFAAYGEDNPDVQISTSSRPDVGLAVDQGGHIIEVPTIYSTGKVNDDGSAAAVYNATVTKLSDGNYQVTFDHTLANANYVIQLTNMDLQGTGNDDPDIAYYDQTFFGFKVRTGDNDNGSIDRADRDLQFMFTVIRIPGE